MTTEKQDKKLIKKEGRKAETESVIKLLAKGAEFPNDRMVEEYIDLERKNKLTSEQKKKRDELMLEIAMANGLKNGIWVNNLSYNKYYKSLATIRTNLVKEYNCKRPLELMLIDRIVASYWRAMRCDAILNRLVEKEDGGFSFDQLKVNVIKEFNKAVELANRQLAANIILFKELKQPKLNIKVRTDSAFIAQNQQINAVNNPVQQQDENINLK